MSKPRIPTARDLMQSVPFTFSPDTELLAAIEDLARMHMPAAPVDEGKSSSAAFPVRTS